MSGGGYSSHWSDGGVILSGMFGGPSNAFDRMEKVLIWQEMGCGCWWGGLDNGKPGTGSLDFSVGMLDHGKRLALVSASVK